MAVSTTVQVTLPAMGESVTEGTVLEWHKAEGDRVQADETLVEISTDKVDAEVPAPVSGTVVKVHVAEGDTVTVGAVLVEILPDGESTNGATGNGAAPEAPAEDATAAPADLQTPAPAADVQDPALKLPADLTPADKAQTADEPQPQDGKQAPQPEKAAQPDKAGKPK